MAVKAPLWGIRVAHSTTLRITERTNLTGFQLRGNTTIVDRIVPAQPVKSRNEPPLKLAELVQNDIVPLNDVLLQLLDHRAGGVDVRREDDEALLLLVVGSVDFRRCLVRLLSNRWIT